MTDIIEGNKLIAEFDGWQKTFGYMYHQSSEKTEYYYKGDVKISAKHFHEADYSKMWQLLMPVVEKIENSTIKDFGGDDIKRFSFEMKRKYCLIQGHTDTKQPLCFYQTPYGSNPESKIIEVWNAVVEFIKWYNQNK